MTTINKIILMGNVGKEPDVRYFSNGKTVAKFPLATNENFKDRQGNPVSITEWHNIEVWDDLARLAERYLRKGKMVYIEGRVRSSKYVDKETGHERYIKYIKADVMTFMNLNVGIHNSVQKPGAVAQTELSTDTPVATTPEFAGGIENFDYSHDISPENREDLPF